MRYILAHDVGTTGNKATLYNEEGVQVGMTFSPYATAYPQVGWAEQNPQDWWRSLCHSTRQLLYESGVAAEEVSVVAFSGQMMGVVPVDSRGRPVHNAIIWADLRAVAQVERVATRIDPQRVYTLTGHRLSASYSAGKMLWLKDVEPEVYRQTYKFLQAKDFLAARLTGQFVTDPSDASGTNLYNLERGEWDGELLDAFGIEQERLPAIYRSTDVIGEVQSAAAEELGLRAGTPVVIGGGDGSCAATGAGVIRPGIAYNYIGSSSWIGIATEKPILDPQMRTFTWAHLVPGMFTPTGTMQAAGSSYQWARDELAQSEREVAEQLGISAYELMNQEVQQSPPGANGLLFLPYLLGERSPRWNPNARGAFVGLTIRHRQADLLRAVLEGITFNLRVILEAFTRQGAQSEAMRVIGGGARSAVWNQIMADVFGIPVLRLTQLEGATSMGAAIAGGVGVGIWQDFSQVDHMVSVARETHPNQERYRFYSKQYEIFNAIYDALEDASIFDRLAALP
ncbi:xylulokinase [Thermogemmatispora carboxidivorans]|uniref:xylulokinase n=1 Tax=Thermogemmatispora carboxidivorans TaxID=1382306 RepID=UPI00069ACCFF|nr:xylulokinase [Thermogemmatispora carboxidivorans]